SSLRSNNAEARDCIACIPSPSASLPDPHRRRRRCRRVAGQTRIAGRRRCESELKETAAQCLALAYSTTDPHTRAALLTMAQKLNDGATRRVDDYEAAQREFNDRQMLPQSPQPVLQQQQQIQPKKDKA